MSLIIRRVNLKMISKQLPRKRTTMNVKGYRAKLKRLRPCL